MNRQPSGPRLATSKSIRRESEGLWDWNLASNRIHFSPGWMSLVGCLDHEIGNTPEEWFQRVHPEDSEPLAREIDAVKGEGTVEFELRYRLRHKDGTYRWMCSRGLVVRNDDGEAVRLTGAQSDVTVDTVTDAVTALPNRLLLIERLTQSIARARRHPTFHFALLLIDLGRPNGSLPKSSGSADRLLHSAARRLETQLRTPDTMSAARQTDLVARVDGDLFAVLLDGVTDLLDAKVVAERVLAEMLNPFALSSGEVRLSPAIGIALSASGYAHADEALRDAETALHRARVLGGSHCEVFDTAVLKSQQSALQLETELEHALQRGDFELAYQPIVSASSNAVFGFEALVRWRHPELGVISPLDFIPIAEQTGLIVPLGRWILDAACAQLQTWRTTIPAARDLWISVNLSGVELREPDLVEQVEATLLRHELPPRSLVLELTEGVAMQNPVAVTTLLMRLRAMGTRISLDDFGTGYSSLAYLRQFPVDALKIDQSFVRGIAHDRDTAVIVTGIVAMAKELGLYVVAEGVETEGQYAALRSLQCESVQGFLVSRPLDPQSASQFLLDDPSTRLPLSGETTSGSAVAGPLGPRAHMAALSRLSREVLIAGVVATVVLTAGVTALVYRARAARTAVLPASPTASVSVTGTSKDVEIPAAPVPVAPPAPPSRDARADSVGTARTPAVSDTAGGPSPTTASKAAAVPPTSAAASTSFDVLHQHRLGRCRGRLTVTPTGVVFIPNDNTADDMVSLKYGEFIQSTDDKTLTIRSADRTFRFSSVSGPITRVAEAVARASRQAINAPQGPRSATAAAATTH
jgi:diguanylate cyclase (GGDEF)-like protein